MKHHSTLILACALFATVMTNSCVTLTNRSVSSGSLRINLESNLNADVTVDMNRRVRGTATASTVLWFFNIEYPDTFADGVTFDESHSMGSPFFPDGVIQGVKSAAAYRAAIDGKADVLVLPQYIMKVERGFLGLYKRVTATVTAYPGQFRGIRPSRARRAAGVGGGSD